MIFQLVNHMEDYYCKPAFPSESYNAQGISQVMFMAAHAPNIIPKWFKPTMKEPRPKEMNGSYAVFGSSSNHPEKDLFVKFYFEDQWCDDGEVPQTFKDEVAHYEQIAQESWDAAREWDRKEEEQRIFQWPIYWATGVIDSYYY